MLVALHETALSAHCTTRLTTDSSTLTNKTRFAVPVCTTFALAPAALVRIVRYTTRAVALYDSRTLSENLTLDCSFRRTIRLVWQFTCVTRIEQPVLKTVIFKHILVNLEAFF